MPETAYLVNPRRRRGRRRHYRRNPSGMTALVNAIGRTRRSGRRRHYRRNPDGAGGFGWLIAGSAIYGVGTNVLRRLWVRRSDKAEDQAKAAASWDTWKPWLKLFVFGFGGWALSAQKRFRALALIGKAFMIGGIADAAQDFTYKLGLTEAEEKLTESKSDGVGNLATVLIERDRQLRAAYEDELSGDDDELSGDDFFDGDDWNNDGMGFATYEPR